MLLRSLFGVFDRLACLVCMPAWLDWFACLSDLCGLFDFVILFAGAQLVYFVKLFVGFFCCLTACCA